MQKLRFLFAGCYFRRIFLSLKYFFQITGQNHQDIFHSYDVWHGAKNLGKKLTMLAKSKGNSALIEWVKDIVNHFWFCCRASNSYEEFMVSDLVKQFVNLPVFPFLCLSVYVFECVHYHRCTHYTS